MRRHSDEALASFYEEIHRLTVSNCAGARKTLVLYEVGVGAATACAVLLISLAFASSHENGKSPRVVIGADAYVALLSTEPRATRG